MPAALVALTTLALAQTPVIVETDWTLTTSIAFDGAVAARRNPQDGSIYVGRRGTASDGIYRIASFGLSTRVVTASNPAGVAIAENGDLFFSEDFGGVIYRVAFGATVRSAWAQDFHAGDDDPTGVAIAPSTYAGTVVSPLAGITADRGFNGPDELWAFTTSIATAPRALHTDVGTLIDPVDVAIGASDVFVVDSGEAANGSIYTVDAAGLLTSFPLGQVLADPHAIAIDPANGDLLIAERSTGRVVRAAIATGAVSDLVDGLPLNAEDYGALGVSADSREMIVTAGNLIYVFRRCAAAAGDPSDCDQNGLDDFCDSAAGAVDCNENGVLDVCDIANGSSSDCNFDQLPDECPVCPPVEAIFVMDTSSSMDDEAAALCGNLSAVALELSARRIELRTERFGINNNPGGAYACLTDNVIARYGTAVPGNPPPNVAVLGACPGGNEVANEDWGRAAAVVAGLHSWTSSTVRLVVPIADEGPWCGDPVSDPGNDRDSIVHASTVAVANDVVISPIVGSGASAAVVGMAQDLAAGTGGIAQSSVTPSSDLARAIYDNVLASCALNSTLVCSDGGVPDSGEPPDLGVEVDAGEIADGGELTDAGEVLDGGDTADAEANADAEAMADAEANLDAEASADATASNADAAPLQKPDGGSTKEDESGCDCATTHHSKPSSPLWFFAALAFFVRRGSRARAKLPRCC